MKMSSTTQVPSLPTPKYNGTNTTIKAMLRHQAKQYVTLEEGDPRADRIITQIEKLGEIALREFSEMVADAS